MKGRTYQANFTMGELSQDMLGRVDLAAYAAGVKRMRNMLPASVGAGRRRPGFVDEGAPKFQDRRWRGIPFQRSVADRLSLEFGDFYVRFWNPDGSPVYASPGIPLEIVSPFGEAEVAGLSYAQSNDALYVCAGSGRIRPHVLIRHAALAWEFRELDHVNGPWLPENSDDAFTIAATGSIGSVTLTASKDLFKEGHVGALFRLRAQSQGAGVGAWVAGFDTSQTWEAAVSDGKVYATADGAVANGKAGTNPPIHESGTQNDGLLDWTYIHDGAGIVRITAVLDPLHAEAEVLATLPTAGSLAVDRRVIDPGLSYAFDASAYWAECAWSDLRGWPRKVEATDEERLAFGGTLMNPAFLALTRSFGFTPDKVDFHPGQGTGRVADDDAVTRQVRAGGDPILWMKQAAYLMIGTSAREYAVIGAALDRPLSPSGNQLKRLTETGSREVEPVLAYDALLHVPRGGRGLNMVKFGADQTQDDDDLSLFSEDLLRNRVAGLAWAAKPHSVCWIWTDAGELLSFVYNPKQKVFGFQRHGLPGGFQVETAWVIHDDDGYDTLRVAAYRLKGNVAQRRIWRLAPRWRLGDPATSIIYLDAAKIYHGAAVTTIAGLDHLEGEGVTVFGNGGAAISTAVVRGGQITGLQQAVTDAVIGLPYRSRLEIMPVDLGGPAGTVGMLQRVFDTWVHLADFVEADVHFGDGPNEDAGGEHYGGPPAPREEVVRDKVGGSTERQATVTVSFDTAWPGTVLAIGAGVSADG